MSKRDDSETIEILQESLHQLNETVEIGNETLLELQRQKDVLLATKKNIKETQEELSFSQKILRKMSSCWRG